MKIVIIDYGAGNIQSIQFAIKRLGFEAILSKNPIEIQQADKVIFPGVGEASSAMKMLVESGLDQLIPTLTQPVLGICLGQQLLCRFSEEGDTECLGIFDTTVKKFEPKKKKTVNKDCLKHQPYMHLLACKWRQSYKKKKKRLRRILEISKLQANHEIKVKR